MTFIQNASNIGRLSVAGQTLFSSIASWLSNGDLKNLYVEGTDSQIQAIKDVMNASKDFQYELHNPNATLKTISEKLEIKSKAALVFEKELHMPWIL